VTGEQLSADLDRYRRLAFELGATDARLVPVYDIIIDKGSAR